MQKSVCVEISDESNSLSFRVVIAVWSPRKVFSIFGNDDSSFLLSVREFFEQQNSLSLLRTSKAVAPLFTSILSSLHSTTNKQAKCPMDWCETYCSSMLIDSQGYFIFSDTASIHWSEMVSLHFDSRENKTPFKPVDFNFEMMFYYESIPCPERHFYCVYLFTL